MQILRAIHKPYDMHPAVFHGRQLDHGTRRLPSRRNRRIKCQPCFIKILARAFSFVFLLLSCFTCTLTPGTCCRVSETFSRLSHTLPSKTASFGKTFEGRNTQALFRLIGSPLPHLCERTRCFLARRDGPLLCFRRQLWGSAAAGCIVETLRPIVFPCPDPCRDGVAINRIDRGDVRDRHPSGTE